jgi:hypothetical protein
MDIYVINSISEQEFGVQNTKKKTPSNRYKLEVALEDKVYSETYYNHQPKSGAVDETRAKIKAQEL